MRRKYNGRDGAVSRVCKTLWRDFYHILLIFFSAVYVASDFCRYRIPLPRRQVDQWVRGYLYPYNIQRPVDVVVVVVVVVAVVAAPISSGSNKCLGISQCLRRRRRDQLTVTFVCACVIIILRFLDDIIFFIHYYTRGLRAVNERATDPNTIYYTYTIRGMYKYT